MYYADKSNGYINSVREVANAPWVATNTPIHYNTVV